MEYRGVFFRGKWRDGTRGKYCPSRLESIDLKVEWKIVSFIGRVYRRNIVSKVGFFSNHGKGRAIVFHIRVHIGNNRTARLQRLANDEICIATNVD